MAEIFNRSTNWIVDRPVLTCLLLSFVSALAFFGYYDPELVTATFTSSADEVSSVDEESSAATSGQTRETIPVAGFSLYSDAIIVVECDEIFTPRGTEALRHIVTQLEQTDLVSGVMWMDRVPLLNVFGLPEPILPPASASTERFAASKAKARAHPFIHGQLLSSDARTLLLLVDIDFLFVTADEDCIGGLRMLAERAASDYPDVEMKFSVTGNLPIYITAMETHESNQFYYQIVGYSMIAVMATILFRGIVAVIVVSLAPALGVFWTLGFIRYFGFENNPFNDVVLPVLVSLVGLTDGVHLMVQIRKLRSAGMAPRDAAKAGIHQVGLACGLTSLTTAIGFGSLSLAHHEFVREFGYCCVIGVVVTFVAVVTTIPLACSTWLGKHVNIGHGKSLIDKNLGRIGCVVSFVLPRMRVVSFFGIMSTALFVLLSAVFLRPDERRSGALPTRSEPAVALKKLDQALGGLETAEVGLRWDDDLPKDSPQVITVIGKIEALLASEPLIGHPLSIRTLIESLPGDGPTEERMSLLELLPPQLKRAYYVPEYRQASVNFRVQDLGISKYHGTFTRVTHGLEKIEAEHPKFRLGLSGDAVWRWENLFQIVVDLAASLGTASLIIFGVLAVVYRSLRIGLISIVPNVFPLAAAGAYLVLTGQSLEIVTVCAFTVCLGIAVDDTIHFLTRYQHEKTKTDDDAEAIAKAFTGVGTALIMTTIILVAGFCTVLFSDSRDHFIFASMGIITLSAALFADMVFLPAMLARFMSRENGSQKTATNND